MVKTNERGEVFVKILYWGCAGSGKTTAIDTLYQFVEKGIHGNDVKTTGSLKKIAMENGSTLYFDRCIFQSKKQSKILYHVFTAAGQIRFAPLRKSVFKGTDAVIFVFDGQRNRIEDNIDSLKELKRIAENRLISEIPVLVMLNKQDLMNIMKKSEVEKILSDFFYAPGHKLSVWNPIIYETIALYSTSQNIYTIFSELLRRITLYMLEDGKAPEMGPLNLPEDVPDL